MRRVLVSTLVVLALAGCGGSGSITRADTGTSTPSSATTAASTPDGTSTSSTPEPGGSGCDAITKDDLAAFIVGTQLLAQIRDKETLDSITGGGIGKYSPEEFGAVLAKMSFLTGDAADGLATISAANDTVKKLAAGGATQADFDAYQKQIGGVGGILKAQLAVNLGLAKSCPSLG